MRFTPKTEKEIAEQGIIPEGVYPFQCIKAESALSKAGNEMIAIDLLLYLPGDKQARVFDFLMEKVAYKLVHFCTYCGLARQYGDGTLTADDCVSAQGYAKIGIQKGKKKDDGSFWPDRNSVQDYVRPDALKPGAMAERKPLPTEDELANVSSQDPSDEGAPF